MKQLTEFATPFSDLDTSSLIGHDLDWLWKQRQAAQATFARKGLPAKKEEDWKYTSLWSLTQTPFVHETETVALDKLQINKLRVVKDAYCLVIVDGQLRVGLSDIQNLESGISLNFLSQDLNKVEDVFGQQVDMDKPGFNALNTMLVQDGAIISIDENVSVSKPIELMIINSGVTDKLAVHLRNLITLAAGSEATVVENYVSLKETVGLTDVISEVTLSDKATLNHFKVQQESLSHFHIASLVAEQSSGSQWHTYNISLGGALTRNDIHTKLKGEQAHTTLDGIYLVKEKQHVDNHTRIDHMVPNTSSDELYKGILDDTSRAVFNGKVIVHKDAQKTDANQSNRNLLLSRHCEIDTKPEMEIYADDVKCGHGSTVGQLDEQQLFALRARGIDELSARSLLTYAFAVDVLNRIEDQPIREALSKVLEQRLPRGV